EAARLLLDAFREPHRPARAVLLPPTLKVRGSTGPARAPRSSGMGRGQVSTRPAIDVRPVVP
ncbi:MAG: LacI family DNA-binding transcriptional regulator, partial [Jiangellaceae bacterium]